MNSSTAPPNPQRPDKPAFLVGITGNRDIHKDAVAVVEAQVRGFFAWLRDGRSHKLDADALGTPLGLRPDTPIIVLSSLAPGADQLVARIAMQEFGFHVAAPLPFAKDLYADSTSFEGYPAARAFLEQFPDADTFLVPLASYKDLTDHQIRAEQLKRLVHKRQGDKTERDQCYRAAGEVVAAYAQVLLVLSPDLERPPTIASPNSVAQAKLSGLTQGVVLGTPALTWADTGPVVHIRTPKSGALSVEGAGTLTLLAPERSAGADPAHELFTLRRTARWLDMYIHEQRTDPHEEAACNAEIGNALQWPKAAAVPARTGWPAVRKRMAAWFRAGLGLRSPNGPAPGIKPHLLLPPSMRDTAVRIARVRRRVALLNRHYDGQVKSHVEIFLVLGFLGVLGLALLENMVPGMIEDDTQINFQLGSFFVYVLVCVAMALFVHRLFRGSEATEKQDDYRSLAEGLRVQFYWMAAGLRRSAATHYLLRQRGELSWVRSAIRSVSFPYWATHWTFKAQPLAWQQEALRCVRANWLGEQQHYFQQTTARLQRESHVLHLRRNVGLFAGLGLAITQVGTHRGCWAPWFECTVEHHSTAVLAAWTTLLLALAVVVPLIRLFRQSSAHEGGHPHEHHLTPRAAWVHRVVRSTLPCAVTGALIALVFSLAAFQLATLSPEVPEGSRLLSILRNAALTYAGFNHLWGGLRFHTENIRRYDAMHELYHAAGKRLDALLAAPQFGAHEVDQAQEVLFELGREALSENAEWLGMHRDRPIEPVLPGG